MNAIPAHIAIIMDGNGRWANRRRFGRSRGHRAGVEALMRTLDAAFDLGVGVVSVYAFSTENWSRPPKEIAKIFDLLREYLETNVSRLLERDTRFTVMGELSRLPADLAATVGQVIARTAHCRTRVFNMGLSYGGRDELARAYGRMFADGLRAADASTIAHYLDTAGLPDPDLIIRTAGEQRLSNFMLFQAAYAELWFTDTLWPDFGERDLREAVAWYGTRRRKFGNVPEEAE